MWSHDSTAIALSTQSFKTLYGARYLLIAHLARQPTKPIPVVGSAPGAWAATQATHHGALGATTDISLHGLASGTVHLHYANPLGAISGSDSATYVNYSDDGRSFLNGTISLTNPLLTSRPLRQVINLALTGARHGSVRADETWDVANKTASGTVAVTYDGTTLRGLTSQTQLCRSIRHVLPGPTALSVATKRHGEKLTVSVVAAYPGAGANERSVDRRAVQDATVSLAGRSTTTNADGTATLHAPRGGAVTVTAGNTFKAVRATVR